MFRKPIWNPIKHTIPEDCLTEKQAYTRLNISCDEFKEAVKKYGIPAYPIEPFKDELPKIFANITDNSTRYFKIKDINNLSEILSIRPVPAGNSKTVEKNEHQIEGSSINPVTATNAATVIKEELEAKIKSLEDHNRAYKAQLRHYKQENEELKKGKTREKWKISLEKLTRYSLMIGLGNIFYDKEEKQISDNKKNELLDKLPREELENFIGTDNTILAEAIKSFLKVLSNNNCFHRPGKRKKPNLNDEPL